MNEPLSQPDPAQSVDPEAAPHLHPMPSRKLRVIRVYFHVDVGGIETRLVDLLPRLDRERFDVRLACIRRRGTLAPQLERSGIPVHHCPSSSKLPLFLAVQRLVRLFRRLQPDIVHAHTEVPMLFATEAGRRAGVPILIGNCHNIGLFPTDKGVRNERRVMAFRDATVHVSRSVHQDYLRRIEPEVDNSVVIYNGVDVESFSRAREPEHLEKLRSSLGIQGKGPVLLNVARLHRQKAHEDLLQAFVQVRQRFPEAVLLLAGGGRRRTPIEMMIQDRSLQGSVLVLGQRSDMRDLYHVADLNVLSSVKEGFSNVVLEAMAVGLPQVVTDVGGNREAVEDSGCALIVPAADPETFGEAILQVLEDPSRARVMGAAARERIRKFSVEEQVRQTEALYFRLARQKGLIPGPAR
jgi:glycosyltransferase involved in cell wall biosynthesis